MRRIANSGVKEFLKSHEIVQTKTTAEVSSTRSLLYFYDSVIHEARALAPTARMWPRKDMLHSGLSKQRTSFPQLADESYLPRSWTDKRRTCSPADSFALLVNPILQPKSQPCGRYIYIWHMAIEKEGACMCTMMGMKVMHLGLEKIDHPSPRSFYQGQKR